MEQDNRLTIPADAHMLPGKSWTAYMSVVTWSVLGLAASVGLGIALLPLGIVLVVIVAAWAGYAFAVIASYKIYYDDVGVWVASGVLPWKKGVAGVKWRDLDEAIFIQNFWSWLFKSYSIRIGHRFTKASEIFLTNMKRGHESAMTINSQHQERIKDGRLTQ